MTHDYKCTGTTTLFAALNILKGEAGRCVKRHRHQEFLKFLKTIDRNTQSIEKAIGGRSVDRALRGNENIGADASGATTQEMYPRRRPIRMAAFGASRR